MHRRKFLTTSLMSVAALSTPPLLTPSTATAKEKKSMNILVLTGSPRKNGNSNTLATFFIKGAEEAGHTVHRFDAAFHQVHSCTACNSCGMDGPCIFQDDFAFVREHIIPADLVAFVTPMYYFGFSSQLKAVIDRFYALNDRIHVSKKAVLMVTYADNREKKERPIRTHYDILLDYLGWEDAGRIIAPGVWPVGAINHTAYPKKAYELGKSL